MDGKVPCKGEYCLVVAMTSINHPCYHSGVHPFDSSVVSDGFLAAKQM